MHKKRMLFIITLMIITHHPIRVMGSWGASTIMEVAADLINPSNDQSFKVPDSLLDSRPNRPITSSGSHEKFIVPMLSNAVGDNNQLMEYMAAAVVARATHRTLCLTPFFNGPIKHTKKLPRGGLMMEERYDIHLLSKFVKVASLERCLQECHKQINGFWWLRYSSVSTLSRDWSFDRKKVKTHDLSVSSMKWTSTDDIKQAGQEFSEEQCVAIGGLFPGLRWRGAYLAASLYMRPSQLILEAATGLQDLAIGHDQNFLAVHWRFEESICEGEQLGLCFLRCGDGAVIDSGLHAAARGFIGPSLQIQTNRQCKRVVDSKGVMVSRQDLVAAISSKALKENVSSVYLATDGWMRGSHAESLVRKVVEDLRKRGLAVTGLWKIKRLPNLITNAKELIYGDEILKRTLESKFSGHLMSEVEQEICLRASSFMGSGESTWSLAVFRARLALRRQKKAELLRKANEEIAKNEVDNLTSDDTRIVEELLSDLHAAGLQCRYQFLYRRAKGRGFVPEESYQDEVPDSWLDMEACEAQLNHGGSCKLIDCFL